jgi:hypothetical protein
MCPCRVPRTARSQDGAYRDELGLWRVFTPDLELEIAAPDRTSISGGAERMVRRWQMDLTGRQPRLDYLEQLDRGEHLHANG